MINLKKLKLPNKPGVYFFKKGKENIYIGKATSLKDRVKSYFGKDLIETRGPLLVDMLFHADKVVFEETDSVLEALILEAELIKKYQPKYNTKEKSDKSFNYVCITNEELPKVIIKRGKDLFQTRENFSIYFGPFTSSTQLRGALKIVRKIFPFLDDKSKNYLEFYKQINLVPDLNDRKMYLENIRNIKLFFQGKKKIILKNLEKEMKLYAKNKEFEKAGEIRRQIFALKHINDIALLKHNSLNTISKSNNFRIEAYDIAHMSGKNMVGVMTVVEDGEINTSEYKKFKIRTQTGANDIGALTEVLERRFAHTEWSYPSLIVMDGGIAQIHAAEKVLKKLSINIPILSVLKDERHRPKDILGNKEDKNNFVHRNEKEILLANSEAHRFAIAYHKKMRGENFLK
ncbi:MAG: UvrB/UvrC motif-containing protein [Patescibacteria group bacterium]